MGVCRAQSFLQKALMPLHKPKCVGMYHQQLAYCVTQARPPSWVLQSGICLAEQSLSCCSGPLCLLQTRHKGWCLHILHQLHGQLLADVFLNDSDRQGRALGRLRGHVRCSAEGRCWSAGAVLKSIGQFFSRC